MRRSSRSTKGQHTKRYADDVTYTTEEGPSLKKSKLDNNDEEDVASGSDEDYSNEVVRCNPCGTNQDNYNEDTDEGGTFIQCDVCNSWQHAKCMGFDDEALPENYVCDVCQQEGEVVKEKVNGNDDGIQEVKKDTNGSGSKKNGNGSSKLNTNGNGKKDSNEKVNSLEGLKDITRISTAKAFFNFFKRSLPSDDSIKEEDKIKQATEWSLEIEDIMFREFPGNKLYTSEGRRILFLLKKYFMKDLISGTINFEDIVKKSPKEINQDIERVELQNKQNIKNIILTENNPTHEIIRRTHKGDIIKENENEDEIDEIDASITTRKVDHRRFSVEDDTHNSSNNNNTSSIQSNEFFIKPKILSSSIEQNTYNNLNPRIDDDDDDDDNDDDDVNDRYVSDDDSQQHVHPPISPEQELKRIPDSPATSKSSTSELEHVAHSPKEEELYPILGNISPTLELSQIWSGTITFPSFAEFKAIGKFYNCTHRQMTSIDVCRDILNLSKYNIEGRLDRRVADSYLDKVLRSRDLYFIEIEPAQLGDKVQYDRLYEYLSQDGKVGVLSGKPKFVKDSYLMAIDFRDDRLMGYLRQHKLDMRIGLFAVFVVQRGYGVTSIASTSITTNSNSNTRESSISDNGESSISDNRPSFESIMNQLR
ncbi:uncharacterized protein J8A68_005550 [[Candida] subhashii]|uniref:PHD-type domain-containing protein n=1 Tax=[Candida] subhashii TaxID=561895 RepID=A0A8J5USR4_9ASCO|nr:uncharacterized protein J8A68_005550 [[Candida] subhashii]KAG7660875.1 hypothetical protein J8A68_005550 [[Candida] subhashii]